MDDGRIEWIDTAKGIGIIAVVLGHIWMIGDGHKFIYSFHMPLFFFVAGFLYQQSDRRSGSVFLRKRINGLVKPYFYFAFITFIYWYLIERRVSQTPYPPLEVLKNILSSTGGSALANNPVLWFLPCLFVVQVLFFCFDRWNKRVVGSVIASIVGYVLGVSYGVRMAWCIDVAFVATGFYCLGYLFAIVTGKLSLGNRMWRFMFVPGFVTTYLLAQLNPLFVMVARSYGSNLALSYATALLGILSVVSLGKLLQRVAVVNYLGRNSLIILCLHMPIKRALIGVTSILSGLSLHQIEMSLALSLTLTALTLSLLYPVISIINVRFQFLLGKGSIRTSIAPQV